MADSDQDASSDPSTPVLLRRRWFLSCLAGTAGVTALTLPEAEAARFSVAVLDAGHGGSDPGAKWGGIAEKKLTLDVAKRTKKLLEKKGVTTVLTRGADSGLSLDQRAAKANRYRNAVFVSVHFNAHWKRNIKGIETFYMSNQGRSLATRVHSRLARRIRTNNRGTKLTKRLGVLRKTRCPAILVECGFLSNSWERKRCSSTWYRQLVAQSIAEGIIAYR